MALQSQVAIADANPANNRQAGVVATGDGTNALQIVKGLVPKNYDYLSLSNYDSNGNPGTIIFKTGGAGGTIVATLTLVWSGSSLTSVARS